MDPINILALVILCGLGLFALGGVIIFLLLNPELFKVLLLFAAFFLFIYYMEMKERGVPIDPAPSSRIDDADITWR